MPGDKAVALRYDERLPAPFVLARGRGQLAAAIVGLAKEYGIPVEAVPELAERLYSFEPGELIPEDCYEVVAELLIFVGAVEGSYRGKYS